MYWLLHEHIALQSQYKVLAIITWSTVYYVIPRMHTVHMTGHVTM